MFSLIVDSAIAFASLLPERTHLEPGGNIAIRHIGAVPHSHGRVSTREERAQQRARHAPGGGVAARKLWCAEAGILLKGEGC
ncbi:hypothetical protein BN2476_20109 [Paraburkholderia piptadeniae]|uniref:Uncharacterized protein n=1 Tax=Paraburkholderia piptadeniae TaxID=1701573 RepID=A0A1N7RJI4_9BURK|nr:hypothetical protein [Paraburkholderia piptadeniae]SIT35278.1 hypothetical protein BN2476_20109 [Paraburkholderia piptadeniae]